MPRRSQRDLDWGLSPVVASGAGRLVGEGADVCYGRLLQIERQRGIDLRVSVPMLVAGSRVAFGSIVMGAWLAGCSIGIPSS